MFHCIELQPNGIALGLLYSLKARCMENLLRVQVKHSNRIKSVGPFNTIRLRWTKPWEGIRSLLLRLLFTTHYLYLNWFGSLCLYFGSFSFWFVLLLPFDDVYATISEALFKHVIVVVTNTYFSNKTKFNTFLEAFAERKTQPGNWMRLFSIKKKNTHTHE